MADAASIHREMVDVIQRRDLSRLRELYHADYSYMGADGVVTKGADAGIAVAETYTTAFPDLSLQIDRQAVDGDVSVIEFTARGTHQGELEGIAPTGKSVAVKVCNVITVKDGKVLDEVDYFDNYSLLQQLGVIES